MASWFHLVCLIPQLKHPELVGCVATCWKGGAETWDTPAMEIMDAHHWSTLDWIGREHVSISSVVHVCVYMFVCACLCVREGGKRCRVKSWITMPNWTSARDEPCPRLPPQSLRAKCFPALRQEKWRRAPKMLKMPGRRKQI